MGTAQRITHKGVVASVDGENLTVNITATSACASCSGKAFCSMSEKQDKKVHVCAHNQPFSIGEEVEIAMRLSQGMSAVAWAYVFPLGLFLIILLTLSTFKLPEVWSGIVSVSVVGLYYLVLYLCRGRFKKRYVFEIEKI